MKKKAPIYEQGRDLSQSRVPSDQITQRKASLASNNLTTQSPSVDSNVVATHAVRPINANDFIFFRQFSNVDQDTDLTITVPDGKIAIVQSFTIDMYIPENSMSIYGFYNVAQTTGAYSFLIDNIGIPNYTLLITGFKMINWPVYFVAAGGQTITLRINSNFTVDGYMSMYGQFLQASGRAPNYEPGTLYPLPVKTVT